MKKRIAIILSIILSLTTTVTVFATSSDDTYGQRFIKKGYTEQDVAELSAITALSDEDIPDFVIQKYEELGDWKKVREAYGIDETEYENYKKTQSEWQAILDRVPNEFMSAMKETMSHEEINYFINRMNIMDIDFDYAWEQYQSGKTTEEILAEKKEQNDKISELDTLYVMTDMTEAEYCKAYLEIKGGDNATIGQALMQVKELRTEVRNRHKKQSGITDAEIAYCEAQGMTNPMDMFQAKNISKGNNVPFTQVVQTYLKVGYWSVTVVEILDIPPEEYIKSLEESIENNPSKVDDNSKTKEMIQQIKDFYSLDNKEFKQKDNQDDVQKVFYMNDYIILMVGSSKAYVCGTQKQIDENNPDVSIFVENDRSYVPIRFLTENYGGSVEWIEETQTVNLFFDDSTISLTIGKKEIYVDGEVVISDVAPVLKNGRTFLPLRACINALDKHVFYSNGLILISESQSNLDEIEDSKLIDEIIRKYYN